MTNPNPYLTPQQPLPNRGLPPASHSPPDAAPREKIFAVAKFQRWINIQFLVMLAIVFIGGNLVDLEQDPPSAGEYVVIGLFAIALLGLMYPVNQLAHLLREENPTLMTLGLLTGIGLIVVFIYNNRAIKYLQQFGVKVGFLGASRANVARQFQG